MDRPKLLAMMRLVDDDRNGCINKAEFTQFAESCIREDEEHERNANLAETEKPSLSTESLRLANDIRTKLEGQSAEELRELAGTLSALLRDTTEAAGSVAPPTSDELAVKARL